MSDGNTPAPGAATPTTTQQFQNLIDTAVERDEGPSSTAVFHLLRAAQAMYDEQAANSAALTLARMNLANGNFDGAAHWYADSAVSNRGDRARGLMSVAVAAVAAPADANTAATTMTGLVAAIEAADLARSIYRLSGATPEASTNYGLALQVLAATAPPAAAALLATPVDNATMERSSHFVVQAAISLARGGATDAATALARTIRPALDATANLQATQRDLDRACPPPAERTL